MRALVSGLGILIFLALALLAAQLRVPPAPRNQAHDARGAAVPIADSETVTPIDEPTPAPVTGPSTQVLVDGVAMRVQLSAGPYFLGQLVAADVALTNHTTRSLELPNLLAAGPCGAALGVILTTTATPQYTLPNETMHSCPAPDVFELTPGHTLRMHQLLPLTHSGTVTLTGRATFYATSVHGHTREIRGIPGPLDGQWPTLTIPVAPSGPAHPPIALERIGDRVRVHAPTALQDQLLYLYNVRCADEQGPGATESGNYHWEPVHNATISLASCPGIHPQWTVSVSAPGYAVVSEHYQ